MQAVAGVFESMEAAHRGAVRARRDGVPANRVNLLVPGVSEEKIHSIPVSETEQPGMGGAMGGVVGTALGMAAGFDIGVAATALIPGVGPVLAVGIAAAALFGVGGGVAGAALGDAAERGSTPGIPADEVFFYEDALRQGKSLVVVLAKDSAERDRVRTALADEGAESIDAAREAWWIGLRDAEKEHYEALGEDFTVDQDDYRKGFEAGLRRECRSKSLEDARECLKSAYPDSWDSKAFQAGFERGIAHREQAEADATRSQFFGRVSRRLSGSSRK